MVYQEKFVQRNGHRIYVREHPGAEPPIILMHGFPYNMHLYDRLVPHLAPSRRVVVFDFLGWGESDKPAGYPYTTDNQVVATWTPSLPNWGWGQSPLSRTTPRARRPLTGHWLTPSEWPGWCC